MSEVVLLILCLSLIGLHVVVYFAVKHVLDRYSELTSTLSKELREDQEKFVRLAMSKNIYEYKQGEAIDTIAATDERDESDLVPVESVDDNEFMKYIKKEAQPEVVEEDG